MIIRYNDSDITSSVQPTVLEITDNAGGKPDSLHVVFSDTDGYWSKWKPSKNDTILVKQNGYDTGIMYVDEIIQKAGKFGLKALSIPQHAKSSRSQGWENIRLMKMISEIAARYGFKVKTYNIINHLYERIDQHEESDLSFLSRLCIMEGYALKITDNTLVIYDELTEEKRVSHVDLNQSEMNGAFEFRDKSTDIFQKCIVRSQTIKGYLQGEFQDNLVFGPVLKMNAYASNQDEANRWARGVLRSHNKLMVTGKFNMNLNLTLAAGSCVNIKNTGMFDGKYFIQSIVHDLIQNITRPNARKVLEW